MKNLVLDGSAALGLFLSDENQSRFPQSLRDLLATQIEVFVPPHWWMEVANGIVMAERRNRITQAAGMEALGLLASLSIATDAEAPERILPTVAALARQHGLTAYDAGYLELAIRKGAALASQDRELLLAAQNCGVVALP